MGKHVEKFRVHFHDAPRQGSHTRWVKEEERIFFSRKSGVWNNQSFENSLEMPEKKVTWLELFVDLVFVAIFAQTAELLTEAAELHSECSGKSEHVRLLNESDGSWSDSGPFGMTNSETLIFSYFFSCFFCFKVWAMECHLNSCLDGCNDILGRFLTFMVIISFGGMCANVKGGVGNPHGLASFVAILGGLYFWFFVKACRVAYNARDGSVKRAWRILAVIFIVESVSSILVAELVSSREALIISALAIHICVGQIISILTKLSICLDKEMPAHPSHQAERYGLFILIVLGEATLHVINGSASHFAHVHEGNRHYRATAILGGILGFLPVFAMWWKYFDNFDERVGFFQFQANMWKFAHFCLAAAVGGVATSMGTILKYAACNGLLSTPLPRYLKMLTLMSFASAEFFMGAIIISNIRRKQSDKGIFNMKRYLAYWSLLVVNVGILLLMNVVSFTAFGIVVYLAAHYLLVIVVDVSIWHAVERSLRRMHEGDDEGNDKADDRHLVRCKGFLEIPRCKSLPPPALIVSTMKNDTVLPKPKCSDNHRNTTNHAVAKRESIV